MGYKHVILKMQAKKKETKDGVEESFYEISKDGVVKKLKTTNTSPILAISGTDQIIDALVSDDEFEDVINSEQFLALTFTDLASRVIAGLVSNDIYKLLMKVTYIAESSTGEKETRTVSIDEFQKDSKSKSKKWVKASIPHKWFGVDEE